MTRAEQQLIDWRSRRSKNASMTDLEALGHDVFSRQPFSALMP